MNNNISDKDKKDWENFISGNDKIHNKENDLKKNIRKEKVRKIDLHGKTLEDSNKIIMNFIKRCFDEDVTKIIVITGKGLRSKNTLDPYISKDLGILKNSVPEFIKSNQNLMKIIIEIREAKIEDGGSGAFYILLKNRLKNKF